VQIRKYKDGTAHIISNPKYVAYMYENSTMKPTNNVEKEGEKGGWLRKNNIDGVNLIKVYYVHIITITMKSLLYN
jgi:uncharacterized membrane protein YkgB